jgi:hypothetical protein
VVADRLNCIYFAHLYYLHPSAPYSLARFFHGDGIFSIIPALPHLSTSLPIPSRRKRGWRAITAGLGLGWWKDGLKRRMASHKPAHLDIEKYYSCGLF